MDSTVMTHKEQQKKHWEEQAEKQRVKREEELRDGRQRREEFKALISAIADEVTFSENKNDWDLDVKANYVIRHEGGEIHCRSKFGFNTWSAPSDRLSIELTFDHIENITYEDRNYWFKNRYADDWRKKDEKNKPSDYMTVALTKDPQRIRKEIISKFKIVALAAEQEFRRRIEARISAENSRKNFAKTIASAIGHEIPDQAEEFYHRIGGYAEGITAPIEITVKAKERQVKIDIGLDSTEPYEKWSRPQYRLGFRESAALTKKIVGAVQKVYDEWEATIPKKEAE